MKFRVPLSMANLETLRKRYRFFERFFKKQTSGTKKLGIYLENSGLRISPKEYLAICLGGSVYSFFIITLISFLLFVLGSVSFSYLLAPMVGLMFGLVVFILQRNYPKFHDKKRVRGIERNLLPALQDILVQLSSGIPLFSILSNISMEDYGELSEEIKKVVREINTGKPQIEALEEVGEKNSSVYFRRTLWQISNGMRAGSDISIVVEESIKSLNQAQLLQLQNYGNKLNPVIMFYMIITVIMPALSVTFLTTLSSIINITGGGTVAMFIFLFTFVVIMQFMFIGAIRSIRPTLI